MTIKKRNMSLDIFKGIMIVLVVIRHVLQYSVSDEGGILTNFIWGIQMPGFMIVSGYFSYRKIESPKEIVSRVHYSLQHYALPFISWFFIVDILLLGKHDRNLCNGFGFLMTHIDSGLWFLWVIFILSIIATVCNYFTYKNSKKGIVLAISSCVFYFSIVLGLGILYGISFIGVKYILYYSVFYGFGYFVHRTESLWMKIWSKSKQIITFLSIVVFLAIIFNCDLYHSNDDLISIFMRLLAGFTGNLILFNIVNENKHILERMKFDVIGKYTLEIYVTHVYVCGLMKASNNHLFFELAGVGNFLASLFITILFTIIIFYCFNSNSISKRLFYGK